MSDVLSTARDVLASYEAAKAARAAVRPADAHMRAEGPPDYGEKEATYAESCSDTHSILAAPELAKFALLVDAITAEHAKGPSLRTSFIRSLRREFGLPEAPSSSLGDHR